MHHPCQRSQCRFCILTWAKPSVYSLCMKTRRHINFICQSCEGNISRRWENRNLPPLCLPCRIKADKTTHGLSRSRLYKIWQGIKSRCLNANDAGYPRYGGRGILICGHWASSFESFKEWALSNGYKENLTIDRIDNEKGYEPKNCRWATPREQSHNRRGGLTWEKVKIIRTMAQESYFSEIAEMFGVCRGTIDLVARNKIWVDPDYKVIRSGRWQKSRFRTDLQ